MEIIASVVLFLILMGAIVLFGHRRYSKPANIYEQLGIPLLTSAASFPVEAKSERAANIVGRIGSMIPISQTALAASRDLLTHAGYRSDNAPLIFNGMRVVGALSMLAFGFLMPVERSCYYCTCEEITHESLKESDCRREIEATISRSMFTLHGRSPGGNIMLYSSHGHELKWKRC